MALVIWKELELSVSPRKKNAECVELGTRGLVLGR